MFSKAQYFIYLLSKNNSNSLLTYVNTGCHGQLKIQIQFCYVCSVNIIHDLKESKFYYTACGKTAYLKYRLRNKGGIMRILSVKVPSELEGQGIGKFLSEGAFKYVQKNDLKMEVVCRFAADYLEKHVPEYKKYLVAKKQGSNNK